MEFTLLNIQPNLNSKWVKTDLQKVMNPDGVAQLWNEMVNDGEITEKDSIGTGRYTRSGIFSRKAENGHCYCGMDILTCTCCKGFCGPWSGCNCSFCEEVEQEPRSCLQRISSNYLSSFVHGKWMWSEKPGCDELLRCLKVIIYEQHLSRLQHSSKTLCSTLNWRRLVIAYRYFFALSTEESISKYRSIRVNPTQSSFQSNRGTSASIIALEDASAASSLARVGLRAALSFGMGFIRRAWRTGEDMDLCSDILKDALDSLSILPEASLFDTSRIPPMIIETVDKSERFLQSVCLGNLGIETETVHIPEADQHLALSLLLELAIQRAKLSRILECVIVLLDVSTPLTKRTTVTDNRMDKKALISNAPLVPFLAKLCNLKPILKISSSQSSGRIELSQDYLEVDEGVSPTQCFLRHSRIPRLSHAAMIDLKRVAVFIMCHLDRLALPYYPHHRFCQNVSQDVWQEVLAMGCLGWGNLYVGSMGPQQCDILGDLGVKEIGCAEKSILILSLDGKVYVMPNGSEFQCPKCLEGFGNSEIIKIASSPDSKHFLALTKEGTVFSWGCGDGGRLGHGDSTSQEHPTLISKLSDKKIIQVACGSTYSAAVSENGELFTWGRGTYGRLGHGNSDDRLYPQVVSALQDYVVCDVACGSGDAQTLVLTCTGVVFSWGDGDYGKLGRGGSESAKLPQIIEGLKNIPISKIACGSQFSLALSSSGEVYTWGKGEGFRLGHGNEDHARFPKLVEGLKGRFVRQLAVGPLHVLALTLDGEVFGWGKNDRGQLGDFNGSHVPEPTIIQILKGKPIVGLSAGVSQSFVWSSNEKWNVQPYIPFVVEISQCTFLQLNHLLERLLDSSDNFSQRPMSQDSECIIYACLTLLKVQLCSVLTHAFDLKNLGLFAGQNLVIQLREKILKLATAQNVLSSLQVAAQSIFQLGWSIFFATPDERAQFLYELIKPSSSADSTMSDAGKKFMIDLMVSSLSRQSGLRTAIDTAISRECEIFAGLKVTSFTPQTVEHLLSDEAKYELEQKSSREETKCDIETPSNSDLSTLRNSIPLLNLIKQLITNSSQCTIGHLRNICLSTSSCINEVRPLMSQLLNEKSFPSVFLLLKFQRLLVSRITSLQNGMQTGNTSNETTLQGAESLLGKYVSHLTHHAFRVLTEAVLATSHNPNNCTVVSFLIQRDITGTLLQELLLSLLVLSTGSEAVIRNTQGSFSVKECTLQVLKWKRAVGLNFLRRANFVPDLVSLLSILSTFNSTFPGCEREDNEAFAWPGLVGSREHKMHTCRTDGEFPVIWKSDVENHNRSGGCWIIINGKVYDVREFSQNSVCGARFSDYFGKDATRDFESYCHSELARQQLRNLLVGSYATLNSGILQMAECAFSSSPLIDTQRLLSLLLGLYCHSKASIPHAEIEVECSNVLQLWFLQGGLQRQPVRLSSKDVAFKEAPNENSLLKMPRSSVTKNVDETLPEQKAAGSRCVGKTDSKANCFICCFASSDISEISVRTFLGILERHAKSSRLLTHEDFTFDHPVEEVGRLMLATLLKHLSLVPTVYALIEKELGGNGPCILPSIVAEVILRVNQAKWCLVKLKQERGQPYKEICDPIKERCRFLFEEIREIDAPELKAFSKFRFIRSESHWSSICRRIMRDIRQVNITTQKGARLEDIVNCSIKSMDFQTTCNELRNMNAASSNAAELVNSHKLATNLALEGSMIRSADGLLSVLSNKERITVVSDNTTAVPQETALPRRRLWSVSRFSAAELKEFRARCNAIIAFLMASEHGSEQAVDVVVVREALRLQNERAKSRLEGLQQIILLLRNSKLVLSSKHLILNGWQGIIHSSFEKLFPLPSCFAETDILQCDPYWKAQIILIHSNILKWALTELRDIAVTAKSLAWNFKFSNRRRVKENVNQRDRLSLGTLSCTRLIFSLTGILSESLHASEVGFLVSNGILSTMQTLLSCIGPVTQIKKEEKLSLNVVFEEMVHYPKPPPEPLTGEEMASIMRIGTQVVRGNDWKWGNQDGDPPGEGRIVSDIGEDGWVRVQWENGSSNSYRMGKEGKYDLKLAEPPSPPPEYSSDSDVSWDGDEYTVPPYTVKHPAFLIIESCIEVLRVIAMFIGLCSDLMETSSVRSFTSLLKEITQVGCNNSKSEKLSAKQQLLCMQHEGWANLGFIRALANSSLFCDLMSEEPWISICLDLVENAGANDISLQTQVLLLRLVSALLARSSILSTSAKSTFIERLARIIGSRIHMTEKDQSIDNEDFLLKQEVYSKLMVPITAPHSSTIAEECISVVREMYALKDWRDVVNNFFYSKLSNLSEIVKHSHIEDGDGLEETKLIIASIGIIGGFDTRIRVGSQVKVLSSQNKKCVDEDKGTVYRINATGKLFVQLGHRIPGKHNISNCVGIEGKQFNPSLLPDTAEMLHIWADLFCHAIAKFVYSDWNLTVDDTVNSSLLKTQQLLLLAIKAIRPAFCDHSLLRKIFKQPYINITITTRNTVDDDISNSSKGELIIDKFLNRATQPSPVKATYSRKELEEAACAVSQHLLAMQRKGSFANALCRPGTVGVDSRTRENSKIQQSSQSSSLGSPGPVLPSCSKKFQKSESQPEHTSALVQKLVEMGFSRKIVERAIRIVSVGNASPSPESVVTWLLEQNLNSPDNESHSSDGDGEQSYSDSDDSDEFEDIDASSNELINSKTFMKRADFLTDDEYESYVRDQVDVGMTVRFCLPSFDELCEGDLGKVISLKLLINASVIQVDWHEKGIHYVRCLHVELMGHPRPESTIPCTSSQAMSSSGWGTLVATKIKEGDRVRVMYDLQLCLVAVETWSSALLKQEIGIVTDVNQSCATVEFPSGSRVGPLHNLELTTAIHKGIECDGCDVFPICGPRFKCKVCPTFDYCYQCFYTKKGHTHSFFRINDAGFPLIFAGKPGLRSTQQDTTTTNMGCSRDLEKYIKKLTVSSLDSWAPSLLDGNPTTYWQSCGSQGSHWIMLELQPSVLIHQLKIGVDAADGSYMPSKIAVEGGQSSTIVKHLNFVNVPHNANSVVLLSELRDYYRFILISILQCRNGGIDCRVHNVSVTGSLQNDPDDFLVSTLSFLASDGEDMEEISAHGRNRESSIASGSSLGRRFASEIKVFVWGLNDKSQLGGIPGCVIKIPTFGETISSFKPLQIAGGSKTLFIVTSDRKVYACGDGTFGTLGLGHSKIVSTPQPILGLASYVVKKVAVHPTGTHVMALTLDGKVFSWGSGEFGKLGHGNTNSLEKPKLIESFKSKRIRDIACGESHSAAITSGGDLYTWGCGEFGRLGHGDEVTQMKPTLVNALHGKTVVQVACGSRNGQTLVVTEDESVYSFGDGDFGKLGRGGSEGCNVPILIERLNGLGICQVECGVEFSLALTKYGQVFTWGKGDAGRLGHNNNEQHIRKPSLIDELRGKKIVNVAVGAYHCLAVTEPGQVYAWGDNEFAQQGNGTTTLNRRPALVHGLEGITISRVACGNSHSICWTMPEENTKSNNETVLFSDVRDPLGIRSLGFTEISSEEEVYVNSLSALDHMHESNNLSAGVSPTESTFEKIHPKLKSIENQDTGRPSLAKIILSVESISAQQRSLLHLLHSLQIIYAREAIVSALNSPYKLEAKPDVTINSSKSNIEWDSSLRFDSLGSCESFSSPVDSLGGSFTKEEIVEAQGGGEAPADGSPNVLEDTVEQEEEWEGSAGGLSSRESLSSVASRLTASNISVIPAALGTENESMVVHNDASESEEMCDAVGLLTSDDTCTLVDLLKLAVAGRVGENAKEALTSALLCLSKAQPAVAELLMELCVTELEDVAADLVVRPIPPPVVQESPHPYHDNAYLTGKVKIPGADSLRVEFDQLCSTERRHDPLYIMDGTGRTVVIRSGRDPMDWGSDIRIAGDELLWKFTSDSSVNGWGWRFTVYPLMPTYGPHELLTDRTILSRPCMNVVICLLGDDFDTNANDKSMSLIIRLLTALAACSRVSSLSANQRMWALQKLRKLIPSLKTCLAETKHEAKAVAEVPFSCDEKLYYDSDEEPLPVPVSSGSGFWNLETFPPVWNGLRSLPELLLKQYDYEEPIVRSGKHLMFSPFFKILVALCCDLNVDMTQNSFESYRWAWFRKYCLAARVTSALLNRTSLPEIFMEEVRKKISEMVLDDEEVSADHENHELFKHEHDEQLLQWLHRRPSDWTLSWGGTSTIYGFGHNHRGQLGGVEGAKVKVPTPCISLSVLRPVEIVGGEQTLFCINVDGKVYATGYGAGGRLGIGGTDSVPTPALLESIQHVCIKKVAVNSGGKHCLALSSDGDVYSWGEGDDGKLGHGTKSNSDRPRMIEALRGKDILDISCGGAHSAAISASGELYCWGKGRFGRLGHGDGEDQLKPRIVEALKGYRVIDVACGSGDAQTLCITDDDSVWSWGDGDYGKLGRGGSDGCKVPIKIDCLTGQGVIKVECGSQFSVALTKSGCVFTFGKGDYFRLGHGSDEHVRRPKKIAALQGKKVISIATGSLHCVACTDQGEVYTWGDNDEGQLGDGTTNAIQRPRLVGTLQGKKINKVTCGSAHTLAWSTNKPSSSRRLPTEVPLEYDLLKDFPIPVLRNRLVVLHHFSDIFCPNVSMFLLGHEETSEGLVSYDTNKLRGLLVSVAKETAFRKVVHGTMVRDKQHGPVIELNRIQVKRARGKGGLAGPDGIKSVFGQMVNSMHLLTQDSLFLPHRVWKVKFVGESVDDCGGGYSESIAEMCDELANGSLPLLIPTPNGREESGTSRDCFLLNPDVKSSVHMKMFKFLGILMGIAIRTGSPLSLSLAEPMWKKLSGMPLSLNDITEVDRDYIPGLLYVRDYGGDEQSLEYLDMPFTTTSSSGQEISLSTVYKRITVENKDEYFKLALNYRLHEFDKFVDAVREGMARVVPVPLLSLFTGYELETMICGSPDIPLGLLKSVATYKGIDTSAPLIQWFWEVMEEFTNQERSLFLRFVWGRTRLPRTIADFRGRDFVIQILDKYSPADHFLPESYTCFFLLKMPRYSCKYALRDKLKYAIHFCKSIDTDEYARVAIPGAVATGASSADEDEDEMNNSGEGPIILDYPSPSISFS